MDIATTIQSAISWVYISDASCFFLLFVLPFREEGAFFEEPVFLEEDVFFADVFFAGELFFLPVDANVLPPKTTILYDT